MAIQKTILLVDDNPVDRLAVSNILGSVGYRVLHADDGSEAIGLIRRRRPDLILLDISFPPDVSHGGGIPWDGFRILDWLRRMDEIKDTPVVFISGGDPTKFAARVAAAGAAGFYHKGSPTDELRTTVQRALEAKPIVPRKKILFVDDEPDWRLIAGGCLEEVGFEVVTARDAAEALREMEAVKLDGIVLDLHLGRDNGLLLLELLKQRLPDVPVLIYTGLDHDNTSVQSMLDRGARRYLRKGTMAELCGTLKAMVN